MNESGQFSPILSLNYWVITKQQQGWLGNVAMIFDVMECLKDDTLDHFAYEE